MTHNRFFPALVCSLGLLAVGAPAALAAPSDDPPAAEVTAATRDVDLVICLDASGSMSGLIDACRQKIWDVCTLLAQAQPEPRLRVALLSYGGNDNPDGGYVVLRSAFTEELDEVFENLMSLQADGGTELVGRVLHESLNTLQWSEQKGALKLIMVAGNESADQDAEFPFRDQCREALQRGIEIHAVFCGDERAAEARSWQELAQFGGGQFAAIDQNGTINIETPFDQEITQLGSSLNRTYLAYGSAGQQRRMRQVAQDEQAAGLSSSAAAGRAATKAGVAYRNSSWDLVDRCQAPDFEWSELEEAERPAAFRGLSDAECQAKVDELRLEREKIQGRIKSLNTQRQEFIQAELAKRADSEKSLEFAMTRAVKTQAEKLGFSFD